MSAIDSVRERVRDASEQIDTRYRETLAVETRESVERHSLGTRLSHWALVVLFTALLVSGLMIWTGRYWPFGGPVWGGYYQAFGVHMWAGVLILAVGFVLFPFYHVYVDGENPVPDLGDVREMATIGLAFVGLRPYIAGYHHARRTWNAAEAEWVAYHPVQKLFFWTQLVLLAVLAATGFEMYARLVADAPAWAVWLGAPAAWLDWEALKQLHLFVALAFTAAVVLHVYFAVLRGNWDILRSMVTGRLDAYVVAGDDGEGDASTESGESGGSGRSGGHSAESAGSDTESGTATGGSDD
jgi:cytochrome b subunit of formate dehydrogenase